MICHHYKTVFVHVPKTAGQSVERVFLDLLGLTWETRAPLLLRKNRSPELGPPRLAHLTASQYVQCKYMTREQFDSYFRFAFVRNPWDRVVSFYKYLGETSTMGFKQYLVERFQSEVWNSLHWFVKPQASFLYDDDDRLLVNYVGRFENLQTDFNQVCKRIGIAQTDLPCVNKSKKITAKPVPGISKVKRILGKHGKTKKEAPVRYQDYYDEESRELVAKLYSRDIELFGYRFDGVEQAGRKIPVESQ
ncbi:MAG TPA: sulfotransferase family protein [Gammaproteobacteria bacterium]|nr:sulfotransferase family protein [Gammaproteobacteria bacterium]